MKLQKELYTIPNLKLEEFKNCWRADIAGLFFEIRKRNIQYGVYECKWVNFELQYFDQDTKSFEEAKELLNCKWQEIYSKVLNPAFKADEQYEVGYISCGKGSSKSKEARSVLDLDENGDIIGIEILNL